MTRIEFWIAFVGGATLTSCANLDAKRIENSRSAEFPYNEFVQFLSQEQRDLNWINISEISGNLVWESSDRRLLAITKNGRAVALVEPGTSWITYYLFDSSDKVMRYKVNDRDVEGAIVDFVYESL